MGGIIDAIFGGSDPPPPPDYAGAAQATAEGNLDYARYTTQANRPNITTPVYSQTWQQDPNNPDQWSGNLALNPDLQRAYESEVNLKQGYGDLGQQGLAAIGDMFGTRYQTPGGAPDYAGVGGQLGSFQGARDEVRDAMLSRVNTDIERDRDAKRSELIAQGIPVGSEAYQRQMEQLDRQLTDARQQAEIAATDQAVRGYGADIAGRGQMGREAMADYSTGLSSYQQAIRNALLERQTPLNELSAFRTGGQVQQPQFQPYGQQANVAGPDIFGATAADYTSRLGSYNAQQAGANNLISGLFSLGAAKIGQP